MDFRELLMHSASNDGEFVILDEHSSSSHSQRYQNTRFANEIRNQCRLLLLDASHNGRLLYTSADDDRDRRSAPLQQENRYKDQDDEQEEEEETDTVWNEINGNHSTIKTDSHHHHGRMIIAGSAHSTTRHPRSITNRPASEFIWLDVMEDLTINDDEEDESLMDSHREDAMEDSYDDLCDYFIEFRPDNINNSSAASLKYSLPIKFQSQILKQQIEDFRAYRRQRFSLFRKGPLVEETTISGNISSLIRFLGYLFYEHKSTLDEQHTPMDMSVFGLSSINYLVLNWVEWLEQRRGCKRTESSTTFQPVSPATVANYLNGLVSIVKYQLQNDIYRRDSLLDQLRNLRSQAESYSMTQKRFEKIHPEWCSWQELQRAREKCRQGFDLKTTADEKDVNLSTVQGKTYLLHLRELVLLCLFTICPPPGCSIIRLLEWNKTLILSRKRTDSNHQEWVINLTDLSHAATRHKTHKRKGAMILPLPKLMYPYLNELYASTSINEGSLVVFPASRRRRQSISSSSSSSSSSSPLFMDTNSFGYFVKTTFQKYTEKQKSPNPSLLRSIFTTWLYSLQYDTEDAFLQRIKSSSAKWKAHSEQIAATVYNKELVYQTKEFAQLLHFCEEYANQFSYSPSQHQEQEATAAMRQDEESNKQDAGEVNSRRKKRKSSHPSPSHPSESNKQLSKADNSSDDDSDDDDDNNDDDEQYEVERLVNIRINNEGEKQISVKWKGYRRLTWEPYASIQQQLPEMTADFEQEKILEDRNRPGSSIAMEDHQGMNVSNDDASTSSIHNNNNNNHNHNQILYSFLTNYIHQHHIKSNHRWSAHELNALEYASITYHLPINQTTDKLRKKIMLLLRGEEQSVVQGEQ